MNIELVSKKLISGFLTLTFRRAALYTVRFFTINIILARILSPSTIGVFNIANSILAFFSYFSDIGLAAAIIQKKELSEEDLKTTFTIQEILSLLISLIVFLAAEALAKFYGLDLSSVWLIRALALGFFLTSLKVLPSVLLERELNFGKLVFVEIMETTAFSGALIWFSYQNFGVNAFSFSVLAQSLVGVILIYLIAPWRVRLGFSKEAAKSLLNFGVPFQLNSMLALLKDRLVPLVIARMVGPTGVGYITWAQNLAFMPLEIMNIMTRITFPAFSRLQDDKQALKHTLEKSLFFTSLFLYPLLFGLLAVSPSLVKYVVSSKWQPALPLIYLFALGAFWATFSSPFTNFLNAIGKIKITLRLMVMWTVLEWLLTPVLTIYLNYYGVAVASALISFSSIIPVIIIKRIVDVRILENTWRPLLASALMALITYLLAQNFVYNFPALLVVVLIGGVIYLLLMFLLTGEKLVSSLKEIKDA